MLKFCHIITNVFVWYRKIHKKKKLISEIILLFYKLTNVMFFFHIKLTVLNK